MNQIQEYSVSTLSSDIKSLVESNFPLIRVRGEVSGFKLASSGHAYFNLKEDKSILTCTCWRHVMTKFHDQIEEGAEIIATGKLTAYGAQSRYQLSVEHIVPAGAGAWMQMFNQIKEKLTKEGLFDQSHKQPLPFLPKKIGLITSLTGSVLHDMLHRIKERCPSSVVVWPASVQGDDAAKQVIEAINGFNHAVESKPEVIIIARGGGSIEDLWCFNDENLARVVHKSSIPIISAIGHETDFTILDFVADRRAPTPTAAAEMAVPVLESLHEKIHIMTSRMVNILKNHIHSCTNRLLHSQGLLNTDILQPMYQRLDEAEMRLQDETRYILTQYENKLAANSLKIGPIFSNIKSLSQTAQDRSNRLHDSINLKYQFLSTQVQNSGRVLDSISHHNVLKRGFALVKSTDGEVITSSNIAKTQSSIDLQFHDGDVKVKPE